MTLLPLGLALGLAAAVLTGCGSATDDPAAVVSPESSITAKGSKPSKRSKPSAIPPSNRPSASRPVSTDPVPPRRRGLRALLLTAGQLPDLNDEWAWTATRTGPEGEDAFGACQRVPITSIGAERVVVRWYADADGSTGSSAAHLVARFADAKSAWQAHEVVKSWRAKCAAWLRYPDERISDLATVPVVVGEGHSYLAQYGPADSSPDDAHFDGLGVHRHGRILSLVQVTTVGQDYNYEPGREPAAVAVRRVARRF